MTRAWDGAGSWEGTLAWEGTGASEEQAYEGAGVEMGLKAGVGMGIKTGTWDWGQEHGREQLNRHLGKEGPGMVLEPGGQLDRGHVMGRARAGTRDGEGVWKVAGVLEVHEVWEWEGQLKFNRGLGWAEVWECEGTAQQGTGDGQESGRR